MTLDNILSLAIFVILFLILILLLVILKKIEENKGLRKEIEELKEILENHKNNTDKQIGELVTFNANYLMIDETLNKVHQSIDCLQQKINTATVAEKPKKATVRKPRVAKEK